MEVTFPRIRFALLSNLARALESNKACVRELAPITIFVTALFILAPLPEKKGWESNHLVGTNVLSPAVNFAIYTPVF
jgi:hypothetical protein